MVTDRDRSIFKALAISLTPFAASQPSFKIIADDARISCDPAEILEAHDPGDSLPLALLREAVEGIALFGRRAQARLVLLGAAILDELPAQCVGGLRRAGDLADMALQKLQKETRPTAMRLEQAEGKTSPGTKTCNNLVIEEEVSDDVSWFFSTDADEKLETANTDPSPTKAELAELVEKQGVDSVVSHLPGEDTVGSVSEQLRRRCTATPLDKSGSGAGRQCFAYGRIRQYISEAHGKGRGKRWKGRQPRPKHLRGRPPATPLDKSGSGAGRQCFAYGRIRSAHRVSLKEGIICQVPHGYVAARGSTFPKLMGKAEGKDGKADSPGFKVLKAIFIDADLVSAYESCAPAQRQLQERLLSDVPRVTGGSPSTTSARALFTSEERDMLLDQKLRSLKTLGFDAVMLSGDFSEAVASTRCELGLLVGGIPARLLHALAADCGAEVLHGLPDSPSSTFWETWVSKRPMSLQIKHVSVDEQKRCFSYPLLGQRQSLLPEVTGLLDGFWEVHAWADGVGTAACTVLLEASCEPILRQTFAELSDSVLKGLEHFEHTTGPDNKSLGREIPSNWMLLVAEALEEVATSEGYPALLAAEEQTPLVAPWVGPPGDAIGDKAACSAFVAGLRKVAAMEEELEGSASEDITAARAVLRRGSRLVQLLSRVST
eukprot:Skav217183  [mRNA]  locus=scaffold5232:85903:87956:+ [translate_table: standard]